MEIKLYKEDGRTIIVIEDGSIDLDNAIFALVQNATGNSTVTTVQGVEPVTRTSEPAPSLEKAQEVTVAPESISIPDAAALLEAKKEEGMIELIREIKKMKPDAKSQTLIEICKEFARSIKGDLQNYSFEDKARLVTAGWNSNFRQKQGILQSSGYASTEEFDFACTETEMDIAASAFAEVFYQWGTK